MSEQNVVTKSPLAFTSAELNSNRRNSTNVVIKSPLQTGPVTVDRSDERFGPEIEMKIEGPRQAYKPREGVYDHPNCAQPGKPYIVEGDYEPEMFGIPARPQTDRFGRHVLTINPQRTKEVSS